MKLIVGLGNPGSQYRETRHNAGRRLVEFIAREHSLKFIKKNSLHASIAPLNWQDHPLILAFPEVYMNHSGQAIEGLVRHYEINSQQDMLVIVDDLALPLGKLRLRSRGSDGGHNGLKSIHEKLGNTNYPRLRLGIGRPVADVEPVDQFVLSPFTSEEKKQLPALWEEGMKACRLWVTQSISAAMNAVNPS